MAYNSPRMAAATRRRNASILVDALKPSPQVKFCPVDTPDRLNGWYVLAFSLNIEQLRCDIKQLVTATAAEGIPCWKVFWPQCRTEKAFHESRAFGRSGFPFKSKEYANAKSVDYTNRCRTQYALAGDAHVYLLRVSDSYGVRHGTDCWRVRESHPTPQCIGAHLLMPKMRSAFVLPARLRPSEITA